MIFVATPVDAIIEILQKLVDLPSNVTIIELEVQKKNYRKFA